ncbi:DUF2760 domain-containing protein [bacterium]|nr:DUF2760 domain-containing protein [bacterium]
MGLITATRAFFKALFNRQFSKKVDELLKETKALPPGPPPPTAAQLLAVLQKEGRLLDFLSESLEGFGDAQVGGVARGVHSGCAKALQQYLSLQPVLSQKDGEKVEVPVGFSPAEIRLVGKVQGDPPFQGVLRHHGWKLASARLPELKTDDVLVPAEVEL